MTDTLRRYKDDLVRYRNAVAALDAREKAGGLEKHLRFKRNRLREHLEWLEAEIGRLEVA